MGMSTKYKKMQIATICIFILWCTTTTHAFLFPFLNRIFIKRHFDTEVAKTPVPIHPNTLYQQLYDLKWYVVGTPDEFSMSRPKKVTIWSKDYVVWRTGKTQYTALENACPHRGAAFSDGTIEQNCVVCPYHGYEYNATGYLTRVPGIDMSHGCNTNQTKARAFDMVEEGGWVYLNTFPYWSYNLPEGSLQNNLYSEPELVDDAFECIRLQMDYQADARLLTENGLDISHIGFVHSFGNRDAPCPIDEDPPKPVGANRFVTKYQYETGPESFAKTVFGSLLLRVENEFVLPHTSISRIRFNPNNNENVTEYVNTIITFASPITTNKTRLYVKNYRNFWKHGLGDAIIRNTMLKTMDEDRRIVEHICDAEKNGRFNMKYDKLANTFRVLYAKLYESIRI